MGCIAQAMSEQEFPRYTVGGDVGGGGESRVLTDLDRFDCRSSDSCRGSHRAVRGELEFSLVVSTNSDDGDFSKPFGKGHFAEHDTPSAIVAFPIVGECAQTPNGPIWPILPRVGRCSERRGTRENVR